MTEAAAPAAPPASPVEASTPPAGTDAPASSPPAPAQHEDERTPKERVRDRMRELRAQLGQKTAGIEVVRESADAPVGGASAEPGKDGESKNGEGKETTEGREGDDDKDLELEVAKAKRQLANAADDLRTARTELKQLKEKVTAHEARIEKVKDDPLASLAAFKEIFGRDYGEYTKWLVENRTKIESSRKYADLPEEVRQELELAKQERAERQRKEEESAAEGKVKGYAKNVAQYLTDNAEEYPITAKLEWAAEDLTKTHGIGKVRPNHIAAFEKQLTANLASTLSHEVVIERLMQSEPKVLASIQAALTKQQQPNKSPAVASPTNGASAPADGPRGLSNSTSTGSVVRSPSEKPDRRQMLIAEMQRLRAEQARQAT